MTPPANMDANVQHFPPVHDVPAVLRRAANDDLPRGIVTEDTKPDVVDIQKLSPVANVSVLELAVLLTYTRYAHATPATIAGEIAKWMKVEVSAEDLRAPIRRLLHIGLLVEEEAGFDVTSDTYKMVISTLRQMMRLTLRDRYVFNLVEIIDLSHEVWGFVHDQKS